MLGLRKQTADSMKRTLDDASEPPLKRGNARPVAQQPLPPAVAPAARPLTYRLTQVPVSQQPYRQLKVEDALAYLDKVCGVRRVLTRRRRT